ncbi:hypothetical protein H2198_008043 [Neophaeococcomyces mojaviensis]|uniref:Uncharacterized protein n=1 Tax=Neophaeococcomyces mojaviensis TaxID=3383035 RepID=A0ACC2ZYK6_9EURO|nr:hypothetical protein H2198_008043 [Knufia sp. JES_112]
MLGGIFDSSRLRRRWQLLILTILLSIILLLFFRHEGRPRELSDPVPLNQLGISPHNQGIGHRLVKPSGVKVIGLIFFGRKDRVQILQCFLERNLAVNGGWLDEIHWIRNTDIKADVDYLHKIVASNPAYRVIEIKETGFVGYGLAWTTLQPDAIYVKIDDDVVWLADDTIPRIVSTKLEHPEYLVVSANMINSPLMGWVHYHMSAIKPYLPEVINPEDVPPSLAPDKDARPPPPSRIPWRYSAHPQWTGPDDYLFSHDQETPAMRHRWLRLPTSQDDLVKQLHRTPISEAEYKTWGNSLQSWAIAAQQHYSFLENLCDNKLDLYQFSAGGLPWVTDYRRVSINLIAVNSTEILEHLPMDTVDEEWLTVSLPKRIQKSVAVDTHALAVHFSFGTQGSVATTDLLGRYLDYAQENACMADSPGSYWI